MRPALAAAALVLAAATCATALPPTSPLIARALADPSRPAADRAADPVRKPGETLAFSGVRPGMTVLEFYPGGGYFTRMISDVVGPRGHVFTVENTVWKSSAKADMEMIAALPVKNAEVDVRPLGEFAVPRKVDLAWVTQNYHDLKIAEYGHADTLDFDRRVFAALKPGGVFLIIDHQAAADEPEGDITRLHRIRKSQVIAEVTAAGFRLAGEGDFLAQPGDDHTRSIFDKAVQGRTDQYALRFVKPAR